MQFAETSNKIVCIISRKDMVITLEAHGHQFGLGDIITALDSLVYCKNTNMICSGCSMPVSQNGYRMCVQEEELISVALSFLRQVKDGVNIDDLHV